MPTLPNTPAQIKAHAQRFKGEYAHKDRLSHHALRLAYCRTEDLRRWFLTQECELFKHKFTEQLSDVKVIVFRPLCAVWTHHA